MRAKYSAGPKVHNARTAALGNDPPKALDFVEVWKGTDPRMREPPRAPLQPMDSRSEVQRRVSRLEGRPPSTPTLGPRRTVAEAGRCDYWAGGASTQTHRTSRSWNPHLALGPGIHFCMGSHIAGLNTRDLRGIPAAIPKRAPHGSSLKAAIHYHSLRGVVAAARDWRFTREQRSRLQEWA